MRENGSVACWGYNPTGITTPPRGLRARITLDSEAQADAVTLRITARRLADGRTEFGVESADGQRVLPASRYFPANAAVDRWLSSSPVSIDGQTLGRINARLLSDGRIEFAFTPTGGERILPASRYFPTGAAAGRWLRSSVVSIGP